MTEKDVVELLKSTQQIAINVWIDGGWGVDALVGRQTREHNDIDIFVEKAHAEPFTQMLISNGYCEVAMEYTSTDHTAWQDSTKRTIDLHLFEFVNSEQLSFLDNVYPAEILSGKGVIDGIEVKCLTPEAQVMYHQGYQQKEKDVQDVMLLCKTFGIEIPEEYKNKRA